MNKTRAFFENKISDKIEIFPVNFLLAKFNEIVYHNDDKLNAQIKQNEIIYFKSQKYANSNIISNFLYKSL
jgi:hypothetical protein